MFVVPELQSVLAEVVVVAAAVTAADPVLQAQVLKNRWL